MPNCDYCEESFADEDAYLDHLATSHEGELGRIDQRRVESHRGPTTTDEDDSTTLLMAGFVAVLGITIVGIFGFIIFGEDGDVHDHGPITVTVDGDEYDFERPQYSQQEAPQFHFHSGDGNVWHMHPNRLTFEEAMDDLGVPVTEQSVTLDGETYDDTDDDTSVTIELNDEPAELDHELSGTTVQNAIDGEGDHIQITIETPDGDGLDPDITVN